MLKAETERVWNLLKSQPALTGFVLVGGSALSLQLAHRISEDLDFAFPGEKLPRIRLDALHRDASARGIELEPHDDPGGLREFLEGGMDLLDYQQDYIASGAVKVSFFAPEHAMLSAFDPQPDGAGPRLATLDELFRTKSLLTARRSRTRDCFDLFVLMSRCGYSLENYYAAFQRAGMGDQAASGLQRLCHDSAPVADEGFEPLAPTAPSISDMQHFFQNQRDIFERSSAARAWRDQRSGSGKSNPV